MIKITISDRGFNTVEFVDRYGHPCIITESSLADEACIWLGQKGHAMHLTQAMVADLLPLLQLFAHNGDLNSPHLEDKPRWPINEIPLPAGPWPTPASWPEAAAAADKVGDLFKAGIVALDEFEPAKTYPHLPERCPSNHYNGGDDICEDCGTDLNPPADEVVDLAEVIEPVRRLEWTDWDLVELHRVVDVLAVINPHGQSAEHIRAHVQREFDAGLTSYVGTAGWYVTVYEKPGSPGVWNAKPTLMAYTVQKYLERMHSNA